jgi:hypothetical protein
MAVWLIFKYLEIVGLYVCALCAFSSPATKRGFSNLQPTIKACVHNALYDVDVESKYRGFFSLDFYRDTGYDTSTYRTFFFTQPT